MKLLNEDQWTVEDMGDGRATVCVAEHPVGVRYFAVVNMTPVKPSVPSGGPLPRRAYLIGKGCPETFKPMSSPISTAVSARAASRACSIRLEVTHTKRTRLRLWLFGALLKLAVLVSPANVEVSSK